MHKIVLWFLFVLPLAANAQDSNCVAIKDAIYALNADKEKLKPHIENLSKLVNSDDKCAKNLVGRMYSEGYYLPRDSERSYAIFYELSNSGYVPAQYNLAYVLTEKKDVNPEIVFVYLQGLIVTYPLDKTFGYIVPKSIELGRAYLDKLRFDNHPSEASLRNQFESAIRTTATTAANELSARTKARKEKEDMIAGILAAGMLAYKLAPAIGSALSAPSYGGGGTQWMQLPSPRFYQLFSPSGQGLYALPIY
jgi:hypothetical protein